MSNLLRMRLTFLVLSLLSGMVMVGFFQEAGAEVREFRHRQFMDSRYHHDRYYPARGQFVEVLPPGYRMVGFGRTRYYFFDGVWYRPAGRRFLIIAPPIGLVVPFLPPYYSTIMVGGIPYYYANEVYYTPAPGGYVVVVPPTGEVSQVPPSQTLPPQGPPPVPPPPAQPPQGPPPTSGPPLGGQVSAGEQLFIYPRQGQTEKKQADDRYECHRWAVSQTGFDPTNPSAGMPEAQTLQKYADYKRAMGACLDGRGYTVR